MSKIVKSVFRAVSKVVSGVVKAVKKVAKSPIGKIILAAATIYFGGAAIMGAMGGASAGTGFMGTLSGAIQGAGAGISSAWKGLLSGSLSSMGSAFTGAYGTGANAVGAANVAANLGVSGAATGVGSQSALLAEQAAGFGADGLANIRSAASYAPRSFPTAPLNAGSGLDKAAPGFWSTNAAAAAVLTGGNLAGGLVQGIGAQKEVERKENNYNRNVGSPLWGDQESTGYTGESTTNPLIYQRPDYQVAGGPALLQRGLIGGNMNPVFGHAGFPVFNTRTYS